MPEAGRGHKQYTSIMGGRAVLAAILGAAVVAIVISMAACLPKPDDPIEWLQREDAVIVQRKGIAAVDSEFGVRSVAGDFTLYGDGTVIVRRFTTEGATLHTGQLEDGAIEDLLDFVEDRGFFDSAYEQGPDAPSTEATTYLYVQTKRAANSIAVVDVESEGRAPGPFRRAQEISRRLDEITRRLEEEGDRPFEPDSAVLIVQRNEGVDDGTFQAWPHTVDVVELLDRGPGLSLVSGTLERDTARQLLQPPNSYGHCWFRQRQEDRLFDACVRPILPYEEHFPEFEPPQ